MLAILCTYKISATTGPVVTCCRHMFEAVCGQSEYSECRQMGRNKDVN